MLGPVARAITGSILLVTLAAGGIANAETVAPTGRVVTKQLATSAPTTLSAIDFVNVQDGFVAGSGANWTQSMVLRTMDGGRTWRSTSLAGHVLSLGFSDSSDGFALVQGNCDAACRTVEILRTADGGETWRMVWKTTTAQNLDSLLAQLSGGFHLPDVRTGYALVGGMVLKTADGGMHWQTLRTPGGFTAMSMTFPTARVGYLAGVQDCHKGNCQAAVFATSDGGKSWRNVYTTATRSVWDGLADIEVGFANVSAGWLYLKDQSLTGSLYETTDGGARWTLEQSNFYSGRVSAGPPTFVSDQVGWLPIDAGAAPFPGALAITMDGGKTWRNVGTGANTWDVNGVSLLSASTGFAISDRPQGRNFLVETTDGGENWTQILPALSPYTNVNFVTSRLGYGVGLPSDPSAVLRSNDGGREWTKLTSLQGIEPQTIAFADPLHGWLLAQANPYGAGTASGQAAGIYATTDGGLNWQRVSALPQNQVPYAPFMAFTLPHDGVLETGSFPFELIERTADGGRAWKLVATVKREPGTWTELSFPQGASVGFMAVSGQAPARLQKTSDGGLHWRTMLTLPSDAVVTGMAFSDAYHGWLLVVRNPYTASPTDEIWRTNDGGTTWKSRAIKGPAAALPILAIGNDVRMDFVNPRDGWIITLDAFLRTTDGGVTWVIP